MVGQDTIELYSRDVESRRSAMMTAFSAGNMSRFNEIADGFLEEFGVFARNSQLPSETQTGFGASKQDLRTEDNSEVRDLGRRRVEILTPVIQLIHTLKGD
ncbi:MAG: hypothetical protein ACOCXG_02595 [Nanoarchaeota archaeon]